MPQLILSHDLGTTGNKATLFGPDGVCLGSEFFGYQTYFPNSLSAEQDPEDYWKAVVLSTRKLIQKTDYHPRDIGAITFSGQMMGALPVDQKGNPLYRILIWADRRAVKEVDWIESKISSQKIYQITGHRLSPNYSLAKILWIKNNLPEVYRKAHKFLLAKDYVVFKLTGQWATDYSDASGTNLFDLEQEVWSEEILTQVDLPPAKLPPLFPSIAVVGEIKKDVADEIGLLPGTPVVIGGGDGPCAATGAGVVREGKAYNYLGSSSWIALASHKPLFDSQKRTFTFHHLQKGLYMPTGTMQAAGGSYQWCRDALCEREVNIAQELKISPYQLMDLKAQKVPAGSLNLLFLPYLMGERAPWWNPHAKGVFVGLTPLHQKPHLIRAVLEGVGFNLRIILDAFREQGTELESMRVIGGGARGDFWASILASIFEMQVLRPRYLEEATSLGAAIAGGVGVGIFKNLEVAEDLVAIRDQFSPKKEEVEVYQRLYPIFRKAYLSLEEVFKDLS
ncbi:MAG: xylulokinase [Candidatus Atribacteria bacterium]|nr:xylulokinase [Candidatus Atribacteria bacterium]